MTVLQAVESGNNRVADKIDIRTEMNQLIAITSTFPNM